MSKHAITSGMAPVEKVLVSDYVRLCIAKGLKPKDVYREVRSFLYSI
jgi:hypothetical protein